LVDWRLSLFVVGSTAVTTGWSAAITTARCATWLSCPVAATSSWRASGSSLTWNA
jgi:hypothetical protein